LPASSAVSHDGDPGILVDIAGHRTGIENLQQADQQGPVAYHFPCQLHIRGNRLQPGPNRPRVQIGSIRKSDQHHLFGGR
jgi:hypothetical protein